MRSRGERNNWKGLDQKLTLYGSGHRKINRWWKGNEQWVDLKRVVVCLLWEKRVNKLQMSIGNRLTNEEREMACELWKIGVKNKNKCYFTEKSWETKKKMEGERGGACATLKSTERSMYIILAGRTILMAQTLSSLFSLQSARSFTFWDPIPVENDTEFYFSLKCPSVFFYPS